jgi:hypothetical protein
MTLRETSSGDPERRLEAVPTRFPRTGGIVAFMNDDVVKAHLHQKLRAARETLVWKLDGLSEYDIRRPKTRRALTFSD